MAPTDDRSKTMTPAKPWRARPNEAMIKNPSGKETTRTANAEIFEIKNLKRPIEAESRPK